MQALPNYLKAKSAEGLKRLCSDNSVKKDRYFRYQIVFDGSSWFAWYEEDATESIQNEIKAKELLDSSR